LIERYFTQGTVLRRMRGGTMNPYLDLLASELEAEHYSRKSIRRQLRNAHAFGRWLTRQQIPLAGVDEAALASYTEPMRRRPCPSRTNGERPHNARGLSRIVALLRRQGVAPVQVPPAPSSLSGAERCLEAFRPRTS
jgi:hypothetical protein